VVPVERIAAHPSDLPDCPNGIVLLWEHIFKAKVRSAVVRVRAADATMASTARRADPRIVAVRRLQ